MRPRLSCFRHEAHTDHLRLIPSVPPLPPFGARPSNALGNPLFLREPPPGPLQNPAIRFTPGPAGNIYESAPAPRLIFRAGQIGKSFGCFDTGLIAQIHFILDTGNTECFVVLDHGADSSELVSRNCKSSGCPNKTHGCYHVKLKQIRGPGTLVKL